MECSGDAPEELVALAMIVKVSRHEVIYHECEV